MRLYGAEQAALDRALEGVSGDVYLFGSRADDSRRGGDIDVLVYAITDSSYRLSRDITVRFQMECDEKIDVLVINPEKVSKAQELFVRSIQDSMVRLK